MNTSLGLGIWGLPGSKTGSKTEFKGDIVRSEKATEANIGMLGGMIAMLKGGNATGRAGSIDQRVAKLEGRIESLEEKSVGIQYIIAFAIFAAFLYVILK